MQKSRLMTGLIISITPLAGLAGFLPCSGDICNAVNKGAEEVQKGADQVVSGGVKVVNDAVGNVTREVTTAAGAVVQTVEKAGKDVTESVVKAGKDATATHERAWKDTAEQTRKSLEDAADAVKATGNFVSNQIQANLDAAKNAERRVREGKIVDAVWHFSTEPLQSSEDNFAKAAQESKIINAAAASAAAAYGGPGGAAAYAAWSTYKATGDANLAFRAGALAALQSYSGNANASMPSGTAGEILKKSAMAGAAGGIAVAAAGGDEKAITEGFLKSGGAVLVQATNDAAKAYSPQAKDALDTVHCLSARDVDCLSKTTWARDTKNKILYDESGKPRIDPVKINVQKYVGTWSAVDPNSADGVAQALVAQVSKLPKSDMIPVVNNRFVLTYSLGKNASIEYGKPAVVLTYVGKAPPFTAKTTYSKVGGPKNSSTAYACKGGRDRTITITYQGKGCKAVSLKSDNSKDLLWSSQNKNTECEAKAQHHIDVVLKNKGVICTAK